MKGGCFILAVESNVVAGTVVLPGQGFFEIQYAGNGYHRIIERDVGKMPLCGVNAATSAITGHAEESPEVALAAAGSASAETIPVVDVVVGYTPEARDGAGGDEGIHTLIDLAVAQANQIYLSSNAKLLLRLAATTKVTYDDSGVLSVDLQRLMNPADGYLDDFLALKQQYHADLFVFWWRSPTARWELPGRRPAPPTPAVLCSADSRSPTTRLHTNWHTISAANTIVLMPPLPEFIPSPMAGPLSIPMIITIRDGHELRRNPHPLLFRSFSQV